MARAAVYWNLLSNTELLIRIWTQAASLRLYRSVAGMTSNLRHHKDNLDGEVEACVCERRRDFIGQEFFLLQMATFLE